MLFTNWVIILPFIKKNKSNGSTPEEQQAETKQTNSATSKRQQKLQARREKGPAVKYRWDRTFLEV